MCLALAACQPALPVSVAAEPAVQLASLPLTGASASRLGASALTVQEQPSDRSGPRTQMFSIAPIAAGTGKPAPGALPVVVGNVISFGFSSDRRVLAFLSNYTKDCLIACLHQIDLVNWKESAPVPLEGDFGECYTPQGNLALYGIQTNPAEKKSLAHLALLDGSDLHVLWEQTLADIPFLMEWAGDPQGDTSQGQYLDPASVFSSDGSKLYLVAADQPLLAAVDFQKQRITTHRIQPRAGLLDRIMALGTTAAQAKTMNGISKSGVLSADGQLLYVVGYQTTAVKNAQGDYQMEFAPLGMQVIDTRDGTLLRTVKTEARDALLDLDGKTLLLHGWQEDKNGSSQPWTDVMDPATGQVLQRLEGTAYPSRLLDGSLAWLVVEQFADTGSTLDLYRPGEAKPRSKISGSGYVDWIPVP